MSTQNTSSSAVGKFWPGDARLVISISMQFEAGGQPPKGTDSPFPKVDFPESVPSDAATNTWFAYGYREGIPRMLDLWDRHDVKVTSHMIGEAARKHSELAREIVARGHSAALGGAWRRGHWYGCGWHCRRARWPRHPRVRGEAL